MIRPREPQLLCKMHSWDVSPSEAISIQKELAKKTILVDDFTRCEFVAGVDVGFEKSTNTGKAAISVLRLSNLKVMETAVGKSHLTFPYVPGLLSFREIPVILKALNKLQITPDILLCDGQGIAHPRRLGIACHLGIITNIPAIGVAKTRLVGQHGEVPEQKGKWCQLKDKGEIIGAVLRTRKNVKPLYISAGHRISLETSIKIVMQCITRFRLPETTRQAHKLSLITS